MAPLRPDDFYSPGRIKLLLWRYQDLVALTKTIAKAESETADVQRSQHEIAEGGFESGLCIRSDLDEALASLDPVVRRVTWDYYVAGYAAVEIARSLKGCNRWFVDRARHRGPREIAEYLGWKPSAMKFKFSATTLEQLERETQTRAEMKERIKLIVARSLSECPTKGPPGLRCPVLGCFGYFDELDGCHTEYV